jgi:hypothetical protein
MVYASSVDTRDELWRRSQQFESEIKNTSGIVDLLRVSFSRRAELCVVKIDVTARTSCKSVKANRVLVALRIHNWLNMGGI